MKMLRMKLRPAIFFRAGISRNKRGSGFSLFGQLKFLSKGKIFNL
jgi:hypothetical protein